MRAKIESAVFSHKFGNPEISVHNVVAGGVQYQCWQPTVLNKVGQEIDFEVIPAKDSKYPARMKITAETGSGGGGFKKPFTPSFKDTKEGIIISSKTMLLSYCKDIAVAKIQAVLISESAAIDDIKKTFRELLPLLELDKLPTTTQASTPQAPAPQTHSTLKPVLITILKAKMAKMNFRAPDMIDFAAGMCGIELKYDPAHDDIIWDISESDAHKIISACGE